MNNYLLSIKTFTKIYDEESGEYGTYTVLMPSNYQVICACSWLKANHSQPNNFSSNNQRR